MANTVTGIYKCIHSTTIIKFLVSKETILSTENLTVSKTDRAMATHSSTLVWKIPWTKETGRLQSTGSLRVGHD